jgi:tetratricopeptide (TPR) repeat protein
MKTKSGLLLLLTILSLQTVAFAQAPKSGGGAASGTATAPTGTTAPSMPDSTKYLNRDWNQMMQTGKAGDFLLGSVIVSNGSLPWDPIAVIVTCGGTTKFTTTTDPKGNFVIAPHETYNSTPIQSEHKAVIARFVGCNVDASFPGYDSTRLVVADRNVLDSPSVGTITLSREEGAKGSASSATSAAASKDAVKSFEKARMEWLDNKMDRAQKDLQKAVQIYPQYAEAWYQLGRVQEAAKSPEAHDSYSKAVAADPLFVLPHEHLASLAAQAGRWQETLDETARELELNPRGTLQVWYYNALANMQLKKMDVAEASAKKSLAMDPLHEQPNTEQLLAVLLANKGDDAGALEHLKNCLTYFPPGPDLELVKQQIAQLEPAVKATK